MLSPGEGPLIIAGVNARYMFMQSRSMARYRPDYSLDFYCFGAMFAHNIRDELINFLHLYYYLLIFNLSRTDFHNEKLEAGLAARWRHIPNPTSSIGSLPSFSDKCFDDISGLSLTVCET
jgi:hypothetical protein